MIASQGRRVRLQDGERFVGDLWPGADERQRRETLIMALWSGTVPIRARVSAKPRNLDGRPMFPELEQDGTIGTTTRIPIEALLRRLDPRVLTLDIPSGRVAFIVFDDKRLWGQLNWELFFPGGTRIATGRFLAVEFYEIEFDGAAARAYIVENLLLAEAASGDHAAATDEPPVARAKCSTGVPSSAPREPKKKKRQRAYKLEKVISRMRRELASGDLTHKLLSEMLEKELSIRYSVSRDTARKARSAVLSGAESIDSVTTNDN